jgi:hypothetical protein
MNGGIMSIRKDTVGKGKPSMREKGTLVVSRKDLASAIQMSFIGRRQDSHMDTSVALEMAEHVLNFFGYGERIIDNMLRTDDRDIFYMLEDLGILMTEREETTLYDGREWRINYWTMKKNYIESLVNRDGRTEIGQKKPDDDPYQDLPDDLWKRL